MWAIRTVPWARFWERKSPGNSGITACRTTLTWWNAKEPADKSFGAFIPKGLTLKLTGDSNDYLGKGLSGGKIIVRTPENSPLKADENVIIGNVPSTAPPTEKPISTAWPASGSASATPASGRSGRRGRARLRIYDRRPGGHPGQDGEELRGRHERRYRLCAG